MTAPTVQKDITAIQLDSYNLEVLVILVTSVQGQAQEPLFLIQKLKQREDMSAHKVVTAQLVLMSLGVAHQERSQTRQNKWTQVIVKFARQDTTVLSQENHL